MTRRTTKKTKKRRSMRSQTLTANRTYKARLFELIFQQKKELLELYNSVNDTCYTNPDELQINTLENAIYLSMHNDLSFIIDSRLNLYEHQSTYNPNIPLRFLFYVSDLYSAYTKDANLYGKIPVSIPTPRFIVFYNGAEERPDREILKLSDLFEIPELQSNLELKAVVLNINPGHNKELLNICKTLRDFSEYSHRVRTYARDQSLEAAVEKAITECIQEGILAEFLRKNRAEAKAVSIYEYDEKKHIAMERAEAYREGHQEGYQEGHLDDIKKLMCTLHFTLEQAMDALEIPAEDRESYRSQLEKRLLDHI